MKKVKIVVLWGLCAVLLLSCSELFNPYQGRNSALDTIDEDSFYAQDMVTQQYYEVKAELLWTGEKCVIWAEKGSGITQARAKEIADEYDKTIRPTVVNAFSKTDFTQMHEGQIHHFDDMLDYANWLADREDGKLTILLLDIKDGYQNQELDSYIAGYFFSWNFQPKGKIKNTSHYSNGRDMIYIDTYPGLKANQIKQTYAIFAHELQHLVNFVTTVQIDRAAQMDVWIDEGLSAYAEFLYMKENPKDKCEWFSKDQNGTIAQGNNFFVWDNYKDQPLAILDDYATVYLFFRWLSLQAGNSEQRARLLENIITSQHYNHQAVTDAAAQIDPAWFKWETLLGTWLAANYFPGNSRYGYKSDVYLQNTIRVKPLTDTTSVLLYPGEGVYSALNQSFTPNVITANISYAGLSSNRNTNINLGTSSYTGNILLTFNANTRIYGNQEAGQLTGVSASVPLPQERQAGKPTGTYILDARDVLGRDRERELPWNIR